MVSMFGRKKTQNKERIASLGFCDQGIFCVRLSGEASALLSSFKLSPK
jgi:hypothetical protein